MSITRLGGKNLDDKNVEFRVLSMFLNLLPGAVNELIASVAETQILTQADRYGLLAAILDETLAEEDRNSLDRLIRSILRGRVQVVEELSTCI